LRSSQPHRDVIYARAPAADSRRLAATSTIVRTNPAHHTLVHRWVEGETVPEAPVSAAYAFEIGEILARIHTLDVAWPHASIEDPTPRDWPELAERAAATGQPWAEELTSHVQTFLAIAHFVDTCERPGPVVLTHKDIHPWNLLARDGRPVVLDWELSGMLDLSSELGSTALSLAKGPGLDHIPRGPRRLCRRGRSAAAARPKLVCVHDRRLAGAHQVEHPPVPRRCRGKHRPRPRTVPRIRTQRPERPAQPVRPTPATRGTAHVTATRVCLVRGVFR